MTLEPERAPLFFPEIRRKLTDTLIMIVLIPLVTITAMLLVILLGINARSWRQPSHRLQDSRAADDGGSNAYFARQICEPARTLPHPPSLQLIASTHPLTRP